MPVSNPTASPKPEVTPLFVRVSAAQERFGIHRATVYRAAQRGELTIHKRGAMSWLETAEMIAWIKGCEK